jgi:hypothetical protein
MKRRVLILPPSGRAPDRDSIGTRRKGSGSFAQRERRRYLHGQRSNVLERTKALALEGSPNIPDKDLRPLVEKNLPPLVDAVVTKPCKVGGLSAASIFVSVLRINGTFLHHRSLAKGR